MSKIRCVSSAFQYGWSDSTGCETRKKRTRMQTRCHVLDRFWRIVLHPVVIRTNICYIPHYTSKQAGFVHSEHHWTLFRTNYRPSTLLQDLLIFSSPNLCWNMSGRFFSLKMVVCQVTELLFICILVSPELDLGLLLHFAMIPKMFVSIIIPWMKWVVLS